MVLQVSQNFEVELLPASFQKLIYQQTSEFLSL